MSKYYVIKGKDIRPEEIIFEGYFTRLENINGQKVVGFSSTVNYANVKKYKTKKRCEVMLKRLEEETNNYKYEIIGIEGENIK